MQTYERRERSCIRAICLCEAFPWIHAKQISRRCENLRMEKQIPIRDRVFRTLDRLTKLSMCKTVLRLRRRMEDDEALIKIYMPTKAFVELSEFFHDLQRFSDSFGVPAKLQSTKKQKVPDHGISCFGFLCVDRRGRPCTPSGMAEDLSWFSPAQQELLGHLFRH